MPMLVADAIFCFESGGGVSGLALAYLLNRTGCWRAAPRDAACADAGRLQSLRAEDRRISSRARKR